MLLHVPGQAGVCQCTRRLGTDLLLLPLPFEGASLLLETCGGKHEDAACRSLMGPSQKSWIALRRIKSPARVSFAANKDGQASEEANWSARSDHSIGPVSRSTATEIQATTRNRRAMPWKICWRSPLSPPCRLRTGTSTIERKTIPPIHTIAATR